MKLTQLKNDDDAVSPVIGVILMVAITVILAAVIATFVLGLGEQISDSSPQANFDFDYTGTTLEITHTGGETIKAGDLYIEGHSSDGAWSDGTVGDESYGDNSDIDAGKTLTLSSISGSDTIRVVWQTSDGSQSATLQTWEGPQV